MGWLSTIGERSSGTTRLAAAGLLDLVLPPRCPLSNDPVDRHGSIAGAAWEKLQFIDAPFCAACGLPWETQVQGQALCASCIAGDADRRALTGEKGLGRIRAALRYDPFSAQLPLRFKYNDQLHMAEGLSRMMAQAGRELFAEADDALPVLVPVPLHRGRLLRRRFNQSAELVRQLSRLTGCSAGLDWLRRTRPTPHQQGLSAKARERNVRGAFDIPARRRDAVKGARVILVDDVLTTGSTLKACARRLKRGGAAGVDALVLARVVPEGIGAI